VTEMRHSGGRTRRSTFVLTIFCTVLRSWSRHGKQ